MQQEGIFAFRIQKRTKAWIRKVSWPRSQQLGGWIQTGPWAPCSRCLQWGALLGKESARPPSLAPQNLQNLLFPPMWCILPVSSRRSPDPPDSWTEPYLSHQGSHLQSQLLVDRKPPCHYLSISLGGEQQTLSLCLAFDLTPKIQPTGERKKPGLNWNPKRTRLSLQLYILISKERNYSFYTICESVFHCLQKI